jgi:putative CocE/NonD family hydrolase
MLEEHGRLAGAGRDVQLVVGPWRHASGAGLFTGLREALAWFDVHLKGEAGRRNPARVRVAVMGVRGADWRELESWPPKTPQAAWHLQPGARLAPASPPASEPDRFRYDPADPTPAVGGTSLSSNSGRRDNRALEARADVLTYTSDPLSADLRVIGPVQAELHLESSTEHFDVFARLCDFDRRGRSSNVCDGIIRCGPGTPQPVCVELWPTAYRFAAGHRIRLQVSGGSHPRFARNLGTDEPLATSATLAVSDRTVFHAPERPSRLLLSAAPD